MQHDFLGLFTVKKKSSYGAENTIYAYYNMFVIT